MASSDEKTPKTIGTLTRWRMNEEFFSLTCEAVFKHSLVARRYSSLRLVVVDGLDLAIRASRFDRFLWLKAILTKPYTGTKVVHVHLTSDERRLLVETRRLLAEQTTDRVLLPDALAVAVHAYLASSR